MASASLSPKPRAADLSRFPVSISPSQESDVPTLAHIAATSMAVDLLHRAMYPSNNPLDVTPQQTNQERELRRSLKNPDARVFQAVDVETGEIVGYAMFRFEGKEDAEENGGADSKPALPTAVTSTSDVAKTVDSQAASVTTTPPGGFSPGTNLELMSTLMKEVKAVHARVLGSKRHVWWTSLMVLPSYQRMGIGTALMRHGFDELAAGALPIWLVTQVRGRHMYQTLGFEDVDVVDVDFSEFMGKYQGFGVHRNICMLRQPGGIAGAGTKPIIEW